MIYSDLFNDQIIQYPIPLLALSRDKHVLLLKQLAERAVLVH
jgi:hypothetical protein